MIPQKIKKHTPVMKNLSNRLSLDFNFEDDSSMKTFLSNFKLFRLGGGKKIYNVARKRDNTTFEELMIFDYRYVVNTGKTSHTFLQTVYMVYSKSFALPHFYMFPEKWYHRFGRIFGFEDIDFVTYPKFSYNYYLKGEDKEFIKHTFDQHQMLSLFGRKTGYSLEGCNYVFVLYKHNKILNQQAIQSMIRVGEKVTHAFSKKGNQWIQTHRSILEKK